MENRETKNLIYFIFIIVILTINFIMVYSNQHEIEEKIDIIESTLNDK
jgi:hypothetical protein